MPLPEVTTSTQEGVILVRISAAALNEQVAQALLEQTQAAAEASPSSPVILNLAGVDSMPSMAIGALVTLWKKLQETRQRLVLAGTKAGVRNSLTVCRLDKLFEFCDSEATALARVRPAAS